MNAMTRTTDGPGGVAVVTGGTSGVGRATARVLADRGRPVAVLARGQDALDATEQELRDRGVPALGISVDVTDADAVDRAADQVEEKLGPIAVWVNSAMVTVVGRFDETPATDFDRVVSVVFTGTANGTRTALRCMAPRRQGRIVQVGSALAYRGIPLQAPYCAAKHAVQGLCDSLRSELLATGSGITVSEVNLPAVNTPQFDMCRNLTDKAPQPVPPIFQPELAADAVLAAVRTGERALNVTWISSRTVLGDRIMPGAMDRLLAETGFDSQQSSRPRPEGDNLYTPLPGDHGCHGSFDEQAQDFSWQEWARRTPAGAALRVTGDAGRRVGARVLKHLM